ncbi:MAG: ester cyclase [Chloroflexota bacterium]
MTDQHQINKQRILDLYTAADAATHHSITEVINQHHHSKLTWHGPQPINDLNGSQALIEQVWQPLKRSFPDLKRTVDILLAGDYSGQNRVSASGYFTGTFQQDWLGLKATGQQTHIRFGEVMTINNGQITEAWFLLDMLDVMRQGGLDLTPYSICTEAVHLPTLHGNGVVLTPSPPSETEKTLLLVEAMLFGLIRADRPMHAYWDANMTWNAPAGIGTAQSLDEFENTVLKAFRTGLGESWNGSHNARYADGKFAVSTGWPSLIATHTGTFLGIPASGHTLNWRIMDFWEREGNRIRLNWVHIDMLDVFQQMGVDMVQAYNAQHPS